MRFVGLFDCAKLEAKSVAVLKYDKSNDAVDTNNANAKQPRVVTDYEEEMNMIKTLIGSESYQDYLNKADAEGAVLNALNYAPPTKELVMCD